MEIRRQVAKVLSPQIRGRWIDLEQRILGLLAKTKLPKHFERFFISPYLARPREVDIEVTSNCDADCIMCPRKAIRRKVGPMDLTLFKKIIDEAVELEVEELHLNGYGEISVLRNYQDYISYIRQKSSSIKIMINTNAMRMSEEMSTFYIDSGVNAVNVTIDGATAESYESIRRHLKLDRVENNVHALIRLRNERKKKYPLVMVRMIAMPQNVHEVDLFLNKWKGKADRVGISGLLSRIGSVPFAEVNDKGWESTPCFLLWSQLPVLSDGTVALCCDDWDGQAAQGNLNTSSIKDIWTSKKRQGLRSVHLAKKASKIPVCNGCKQPRQGPVWFKG